MTKPKQRTTQLKIESNYSEYCKELITSGRGEELLHQFFIKFYLMSQPKPIPKSIPFLYREDWRTHEVKSVHHSK